MPVIEANQWPFLLTGASLLILLCVVVAEFFETRKSPFVVKEKSFVSASFMGVFFVVELLAGRYSIGRLNNIGQSAILWWACAGCIIVVIGVAVNLIARIQLGGAWSNDIAVYENQKLFRGGLYRYVRHPLYSSIILIALGLAVIYADYLALILTIAIFLPMICHRTAQEESLLRKHLPGYTEYTRETAMFIPLPFRSFFVVRETDVNRLALRLCRATTVLLLLISLVTRSWWLAGVVLILMLYSTTASISHSPLVLLYSRLFRGSKRAINESVDVNAIRFAQGMGSTLLIIAFLLYFMFNHPLGAWVMVSIVLLSTAMGSMGYCFGAYIYFGLRKLYGFDRPE
jgi:protein-S-isoprenylcysteine O-methyltransferase Ste14